MINETFIKNSIFYLQYLLFNVVGHFSVVSVVTDEMRCDVAGSDIHS